jgi:hypothetical protein
LPGKLAHIVNLCKCTWQWIKVDSSNPAKYTRGSQRISTKIFFTSPLSCWILSLVWLQCSCYFPNHVIRLLIYNFSIFCFSLYTAISCSLYLFLGDNVNTEINFCLPFKGFDFISSADVVLLINWSRPRKIPDISASLTFLSASCSNGKAYGTLGNEVQLHICCICLQG